MFIFSKGTEERRTVAKQEDQAGTDWYWTEVNGMKRR